jgi:hypothetical protein
MVRMSRMATPARHERLTGLGFRCRTNGGLRQVEAQCGTSPRWGHGISSGSRCWSTDATSSHDSQVSGVVNS